MTQISANISTQLLQDLGNIDEALTATWHQLNRDDKDNLGFSTGGR